MKDHKKSIVQEKTTKGNNNPYYFKHGDLTITTVHHFNINGKSFSDVFAEYLVNIIRGQNS